MARRVIDRPVRDTVKVCGPLRDTCDRNARGVAVYPETDPETDPGNASYVAWDQRVLLKGAKVGPAAPRFPQLLKPNVRRKEQGFKNR